MKSVFVISALLASSVSFAGTVHVADCKEDGIDLTSAVEMRSFGHGEINVFKTDRVEPAAGAVGLAVVVNRGDDLESMESFCKHISPLSDLDLRNAKSVYNQKTNTLGLILNAQQMRDDGTFGPVVLRVAVKKSATEAQLVRASVK